MNRWMRLLGIVGMGWLVGTGWLWADDPILDGLSQAGQTIAEQALPASDMPSLGNWGSKSSLKSKGSKKLTLRTGSSKKSTKKKSKKTGAKKSKKTKKAGSGTRKKKKSRKTA